MRSITPHHFSLSPAYRPFHSSRGGRKVKGRGLRRGEERNPRRNDTVIYAITRVFRTRVRISCWSRSGCFTASDVPFEARGKDGQRNWTRRVTAAILEKFRSRHSRSFLLWEEARGQGNGERERERKVKKRGKKGNGSS